MKNALHDPVKDRLPPKNPLRIIGDLGKQKGSAVAVFFGGIHGNEPAGVMALEELISELEPQKEKLNGRVVCIRGNIQAFSQKRRYVEEDLNRLWTKEAIERIRIKPTLFEEEQEMLEILELMEQILDTSKGPFYFFDLHTTSGMSAPFLTINDALINRKFAVHFSVPIILGIEEFLSGPLLSYVNELGYLALGFEAGQHQDPSSVERCKAFSYLCLEYTGILDRNSPKETQKHKKVLEYPLLKKGAFFEIIETYRIAEFDDFRMLPGFESFQEVAKGTPVALHQGREISFPANAHIFMPLYQSQGKEGFFVIRQIPNAFLRLSQMLRKFKFDDLLVALPGVTWEDRSKQVLRVDRRTARFMAKQFFHLLGYRLKVTDGPIIRLHNRERVSKKKSYKKSSWWRMPIGAD